MTEKAIQHFKYGIDCDIFKEPVRIYAILAVAALEKQIPKKPTPHKVEGGKIKIGNGWWREGTTVHKCPRCDAFISRTYTYCYNCGQALLWEGDSK